MSELVKSFFHKNTTDNTSEFSPEQLLRMAVIDSGIREHDVEFFEDSESSFDKMCYELNLDPEHVYTEVRRLWKKAHK